MKILIINPNSSHEMTKLIDRVAKSVASPGTEIETIDFPQAPALINNSYDVMKCAYYSIEAALAKQKEYDGLITACHSDPGLLMMKEVLEKPCTGIGFISEHMARLYGDRITILTLSEATELRKRPQLRSYFMEESLYSYMPTGFTEEMNEEEAKACLLKAGQKALEAYHSDVLILGCGGMSGLSDYLEAELGVPVMDGVVLAVEAMEKMIAKHQKFHQ